MVSIHAEPTFERLRYSLGGDRPSQTARLTVSPDRIHGRRLEIQQSKSGIPPAAPQELTPLLPSLPPILYMGYRIPVCMRELSYLKIPPREQEKNKVLLLRGERLYEETTGELREQLEMVTQQFERILDRQDPLKIEEARKDYEEALDWIEEEMWI